MLFEDTQYLQWLLNTGARRRRRGGDHARARGAGWLCAGAHDRGLGAERSASRSSSPIWCRRRSCSFRSRGSSPTLGLQDSLWSLVLVYPSFTVPFCTWLLMGFFKAIPRDLEDAAMIDGLSAASAPSSRS